MARWKSEIDAARSGTGDQVKADVLFWRSALEENMDEATEMATMDALLGHANSMGEVQGPAFYKQALGIETGTLEHLDEWISTLEVQPKTKDMHRADVRRMAARPSHAASRLETVTVNRYSSPIDGGLKMAHFLGYRTFERKSLSLRHFSIG